MPRLGEFPVRIRGESNPQVRPMLKGGKCLRRKQLKTVGAGFELRGAIHCPDIFVSDDLAAFYQNDIPTKTIYYDALQFKIREWR